jgi:serine/threonine protein kinase
MDKADEDSIDHTGWSYPECDIQLQDKVLGRGAFGEVKVAKWRGILVAAKRLHSLSGGDSAFPIPREDEIQIMVSLRKEMDLLSKLRHPNLVLFLGICYDAEHRPTTILTELMPCSLYDVMETFKVRLSLPEILDIALDIASGLEYLHAHDPVIVHRDISSKNVLLGGNHAKITDLGQAKVFGSSFLSRQTTMPGAMAYSAPEVLTGKYSTKIDIFSFGVLVIQMCCGDYPRIEKREEQLKRACNTHLALSQLMVGCVSYIPEDRPSARNISEDLKNIIANDRYYPPSRRMPPENDLGVLARRWMTDQIEDRVRGMKLTLEQTSRMVGVEELRWREEAERVERKEKQLRETQQLLSRSDEEVMRLNSQVEALRKQHEEDVRSLETQRQINLTLTSEKSNLEQRISYIQSACNNASTEVIDLRNQIEASKEKSADMTRSYEAIQEQIARMHRQELEMQLQLNMQVELTRDTEARLEQALSRWKQEKELCVKESERCSRLRSNCSELVDKNERLQMELDRQAAKLQLYDTLPMPDEIRERMKHLDATAKQKSAEAEKMLSAFQELKADHDALMERNEGLNGHIRDLNASLDAAKDEKTRLGKEIDSLKLDRMELQFKLKDLEAAYTAFQDQSSKDMAELEKKIDNLKDNLRQERSLFAHHIRTLQSEKEKPRVRHEIEKPLDAAAIINGLPNVDSIAPSNKPVVEEVKVEKEPTEEELAYQR